MNTRQYFYFGSAEADRVKNTGWFLGQFVPAHLGLRHQNEVELKWGVHSRGDKRPLPPAYGHGTTVSVLVRGTFRLHFQVGRTSYAVTLEKEGDYVVFGPEVMHSWEAIDDAIVLSIRFPSVEVLLQSSVASD
jgi:hypothetical protein